ncbi:xylose isomerase domain-containing protein TIM barrel [Apiospora phragmitis]|uniref:Xylose isomerase domain-containing protein TIM barrel n=1 Tax=Apiospora phragmitis TaxID=2905665 RepID=A0ABR1VT10_9PEZI
MHLSAHNWMRPEPLEHSLQRLSKLGYTSLELAGEPAWYPIEETRELLKKYNIRCWGTVTLQYGTRDLTSADAGERRATVQYMKDVVALSAALGGEITTIVPGRVGKTVATASAEDEWRWVVASLREVAAFAQEKQIRIGIEPLNRFETHFLNRADQALALADEVGLGCGIAFDPFHLALEECDILAAMRACGGRIVDFHVADHIRLAAGEGSFDWSRLTQTLAETGYDGGLAVECMPPIDRTPVGRFGAAQLETRPLDVPEGQLQFIVDHGSAVLSDEYYTQLLKTSAATMRKFI